MDTHTKIYICIQGKKGSLHRFVPVSSLNVLPNVVEKSNCAAIFVLYTEFNTVMFFIP